jgi:predicted dehydrogenase
MTLPVPVGVIGAGRVASALVDHEAPLRGARLARWAPSPNGTDRSRAATHAERTGAGFTPDWNALAEDPSLPAVLVVCDEPGRMTAVEAALLAGKIVCCPVPAVTKSIELDRLSAALSRGGALMSAGVLRHTPAGKRALRIAAAGELGTLHSVYAAVRFPWGQPAQPGQDILDAAGWEAFDFLLSLTPAPVRRVHAHTGTLFGMRPNDTAVLTIRFADDVIATIELSRCLPPAVPVPPSGDVEVEVIGARQAIRIVPGATAVQVLGEGTALRPWVEEPVISMVEELAALASGETRRTGQLDPLRRAVALMDAVRARVP